MCLHNYVQARIRKIIKRLLTNQDRRFNNRFVEYSNYYESSCVIPFHIEIAIQKPSICRMMKSAINMSRHEVHDIDKCLERKEGHYKKLDLN